MTTHSHPHTQSTATNPFDQQTEIPGVKRILAVSSGKGGVGKSTVSVNLACALAQTGARVGLLDTDLYGPSIPRMMGALHQRPEVLENRKIQPLERHGIKLMSIGFLVDENAAVVWRGPMLFKAIDQFIRDVQWGELDYLVCDLPPGTGDIQLSLAQKVPITAAITVTTPQNVALSDVKRSLDMFQRVGVPVLGVVENMSSFTTPEGQKIQLFPKGELDQYLAASKLEKLGEVPFYPSLGLASEAGIPVALSKNGSPESLVFLELAKKIRFQLESIS